MNDPFGWKDAVSRAIASPHLAQFDDGGCVDNDGRAAVFHLAVSLGKCRLFNIDLGETDGTLSVEMATTAARQRQKHLDLSQQDFANLPNSEDALEAATEILFTRMDFWAVFLAVDEAYQEAIETKVPAKELRAVIGSCLDLLEHFDELLRKNARFFLPVAGTHLLDNWRTLLHSNFEVPWWINPR